MNKRLIEYGAEAVILVREFVEDIKLAYGTGKHDQIDEEQLDWPDLAMTYARATGLLNRVDKKR